MTNKYSSITVRPAASAAAPVPLRVQWFRIEEYDADAAAQWLAPGGYARASIQRWNDGQPDVGRYVHRNPKVYAIIYDVNDGTGAGYNAALPGELVPCMFSESSSRWELCCVGFGVDRYATVMESAGINRNAAGTVSLHVTTGAEADDVEDSPVVEVEGHYKRITAKDKIDQYSVVRVRYYQTERRWDIVDHGC